MKAINIRAPWWWFILHGGKDIENRDWPTAYRGEVLIHASKWWGAQNVREDAYVATRLAGGPHGLDLRHCEALGGHLVGRVTLVDCVRASSSPWFFGEWGFVLENPVAFAEPVPYRGSLRLFDVPESVVPGGSPAGARLSGSLF